MTITKRKTIHFFRHAQGTHNLSEDDPEFSLTRDPSLTLTGVAQAVEILAIPCARNFKKPTLITTSTTLHTFHPKFNTKLYNAIAFGMEFPHSNHSPRRLKKMFGSGIVKFLADQ
jgi:hypothetical protein